MEGNDFQCFIVITQENILEIFSLELVYFSVFKNKKNERIYF